MNRGLDEKSASRPDAFTPGTWRYARIERLLAA